MRKTYTQEQVIGDYQGYIKSYSVMIFFRLPGPLCQHGNGPGFNQTNGYGFIACEAAVITSMAPESEN